MTNHATPTTDDPSPTTTLTDPAALRDHADVPYREVTRHQEDADYCENGVAGRAIAVVTDETGRSLLLIHEEPSAAVLPNAELDEPGDWAAAIREGVEERTGVAIELDSVELVREQRHVLEGESEPHSICHHVVFSGSPIDERPEPDYAGGDEPWNVSAGWHHELPEGVTPPPGGAPKEDVERFLD